jgi:hypothetical protein
VKTRTKIMIMIMILIIIIIDMIEHENCLGRISGSKEQEEKRY